MILQYTHLVNLLGSPMSSVKKKSTKISPDELISFFSLAAKNKIPLFYLEWVKSHTNSIPELSEEHEVLKHNEENVSSQIEEIALILGNKGINYAFFKTIKPFPYIGSDIDLLFFGSDSQKKAMKLFTENGYLFLDSGPRNFTMRNPRTAIKIDLYGEITVSRVSYLSKEKFDECVIEVSYDDVVIPVLTPQAELVSVIAHSFYKEQMYTLADFYTIILTLSILSPSQIKSFIELVRAQKIEFACSVSLALTEVVHNSAFGKTIESIDEILSNFCFGPLIVSGTRRALANLATEKMPIKHDYMTVLLGLIEKNLKDKRTRRSIPVQIKQMISSPNFIKGFIEHLLLHAHRETY